MVITSLFDLDRTVREATARLARARRALRDHAEWDEPIANPLAPLRELLSRQTYVELADVPDPLLVPALRAHVARLTLARVLWDDEVRVARAWGEASVALDESVRLPKLPSGLVATASGAAAGLVAPRTLLLAVLADSDDVRRGGSAGALGRAARQRLRDPVRFMAERRAAAAAQLGVGLDAIDLPCPAGVLDAAAGELLAGTQEAAERFAPWDRGFARAMAHEAVHGWPARLGPRWVLSVFAGTDLARGAPVVDVRLPAALGGASFARALALFGQAFAEATAPAGLPFALARPVVDLRPHRLGALFGLLVGEPVFARAFIARLRLGAAAARSRSALLPPRADLDDRFCEETARAWGEPLPPELAGVLPRITESTPAHFAGALLASLDRKRLIETFDDDWYRNPRSVEALRALATDSASPIPEDLLREAASELARTLTHHAT